MPPATNMRLDVSKVRGSSGRVRGRRLQVGVQRNVPAAGLRDLPQGQHHFRVVAEEARRELHILDRPAARGPGPPVADPRNCLLQPCLPGRRITRVRLVAGHGDRLPVAARPGGTSWRRSTELYRPVEHPHRLRQGRSSAPRRRRRSTRSGSGDAGSKARHLWKARSAAGASFRLSAAAMNARAYASCVLPSPG